MTPIVLVVILVLGLVALFSSVRIAQEYERGVVFRLGRLMPLRGPGFFLIIPFGIDRLLKIDLRTITLEVPPKEVITRDNVTIKVIAVIYFKIVDPQKAVTQVLNYVNATSQIAQTTLRSVLGESTLDELLAQRENVNQKLQRIIDEHTEPWGVKVSTVEVKDVELPQSMQRAMAKEAESEREKRAKIIHARGEFEASQQLMEAAEVIGREPGALQLRYLQTLTEIGVEKNTTIVFPLPLDLVAPILEMRANYGARPDDGRRAARVAGSGRARKPVVVPETDPPPAAKT
jgi:regulator of protease activity HflC (stomatin/prohibitin superfamily)